MPQSEVHYDGFEAAKISLSPDFVCFVPTNDTVSVFIAHVNSLRNLAISGSFSTASPQLACSEASDIFLLQHYQLANLVYILTYNGSHLRIRCSQLSVSGEIEYR